MIEVMGHAFEVDRNASRRIRDVRIYRCTRCRRSARIGMRSLAPLEESFEALKLKACEGVSSTEGAAPTPR